MTLDLSYYQRKIIEKSREKGKNRINIRELLIPRWILIEMERRGHIRFISANEIEIVEPLENLKVEKEEKKEISEEEAKTSIEKYKGILLDEKNPLNLLYGYEDLKLLVMRSLEETGVHFLFVGSPATGKTLILEAIELLKPESSYFIDGAHLTTAGLEDILIQVEPRYLLIDEIDKCKDRQIWDSMLNLMETGRLKLTKHKKMGERLYEINIYATANKTDKLPEQLLDRFLVFHFRQYTKEEMKEIIYHCLVKIARYEEDFAKTFSETYVNKMKKLSVRQALRIAKLCKRKEDIEFVLNTLLKYSNSH